MLRHHDITRDVAAVPRADSLEFCFESVFRHQTIEQRHALIAAERDEMQAALGLIADWFDAHLLQIVVGAVAHPPAKKRGKGGATPNWEFHARGAGLLKRSLKDGDTPSLFTMGQSP